MNSNDPEWFSVKCVFVYEPEDSENLHRYEERITTWSASDIDKAIELAELEAKEYGSKSGLEYTDFCTAFHLYQKPDFGKEVFSIMSDSDLEVGEYLDRFYDTGNERTQENDPEGKLENLLDYEKTLLEALETTRLKIKKLKSA